MPWVVISLIGMPWVVMSLIGDVNVLLLYKYINLNTSLIIYFLFCHLCSISSSSSSCISSGAAAADDDGNVIECF